MRQKNKTTNQISIFFKLTHHKKKKFFFCKFGNFRCQNQLFRGSFATFGVDFDDYFGDISLPSAEEGPCDSESRKQTTKTQQLQRKLTRSTFRLEVRSVAVNKNTSRSTKQWTNVFHSLPKYRHLENFGTETMPPGELDTILTKFYAEVKEKGWKRLRARIAENHVKWNWASSEHSHYHQKRSLPCGRTVRWGISMERYWPIRT